MFGYFCVFVLSPPSELKAHERKQVSYTKNKEVTSLGYSVSSFVT